MKGILLSAVSIALVSLSATPFADVTTQYSMVTDLTGSETATDAASLTRSKNAIGGRVSTMLSAPGLPITVWYFIFNKPHHCVGPIFADPVTGAMTHCGFDDVFACPGGSPGGPADPAVINASGRISTRSRLGDGSINLEYGLKGGKSACGGPNQPCCFGKLRKNNARHAEVHLLVDEHHVFDGWITDLFFPNPVSERNQRVVIFMALDNDDDSD